MELSDREAVEQTCAGDTDAFRVLVERHSRNVFKLGYRMTGNEQDAEDVVQETFLRAYRQLKTFDGRASFGTWIFRVAANYSRDLIRARRRREDPLVFAAAAGDGNDPVESVATESPAPDRLAFSGQIQEILVPAMDSLTPMERAAFVLRHFEGQCMEEIGEALGIQANAAKQSVFRAVQKLRRALEPAVSSVR